MKAIKHISRLTLDIPESLHKKLKASAANKGISMKTLVLNTIETNIEDLCDFGYSHKPNKETILSIKEAEQEIGKRKKYSNISDLMKDLDE